MSLFSERYGYKKPSEVFIRECMPDEVINVLCSAFEYLRQWIDTNDEQVRNYNADSYRKIEEYLWVQVMRRRVTRCSYSNGLVVEYYLDSDAQWYEKLDLLEISIKIMRSYLTSRCYVDSINRFIDYVNMSFKNIGYAYRIVNDQVVEITNSEEISTIETALASNNSSSTHFAASLELLSKRPTPDYRNSIKESISAVEYICREATGKNSLGKALDELEFRGVQIPKMLTEAFEKLYVYTNDKTTGIRHALMDGTNEPGFDEAKFMLVACCAFVNYLKSKL